MKMNRDLFVTVTVAVGAFLQGWVYALLIGYPSFMMNQLHLENGPIQDSLVWLVSTIGVLLAVLSGKRGGIGRRPLLIFSSMLYLFSSIVMPLSGNLTLILVAKFVDGFATGFSYILLIFYFMETSHGRFLRYLLPQFVSLCGLCLSSVVGSWELMFNIAFSLSVLYFILAVFCLPESPKWLVRKGRIEEARHVLQKLRGTQDVSDEMHMLIFSVRLETATSIEDLNGGGDDLEYGPQDVSSEDLSKPAILDTASITSQDAALTDPLLITTNAASDASVLTTRALN